MKMRPVDDTWSQDAIKVTSDKVTVQDANCSVLITKEGSFLQKNGGAEAEVVIHSSTKKCNETYCQHCLFYELDLAKHDGREERIGAGAQGSVYRFRGPRRQYFVRKEVSMGGSNFSPVALSMADDATRHGLAASLEGEINRLFYSSPHVVKLLCLRLMDKDQQRPSQQFFQKRKTKQGKLGSPCSSTSTTNSSKDGTNLVPLKKLSVPGGNVAVEIVLENMDNDLNDLRERSAMIEQRILNKIAARYPPHDPVEMPIHFESSITAALIVVITAVSSFGRLKSIYKPYYKKCPCKCVSHEKCDSDMSELIVLGQSSAGIIPEIIIFDIAKQITCALVHMGKCNIIHKDLKPSNILLKRDGGLIKLGDFGTSKKGTKTENDKGVTQALSPYIMCTRIYKSPELAGVGDYSLLDSRIGLISHVGESGNNTVLGSRVTSAADIWSVGLTLLVLVNSHSKGPWPDGFVGINVNTFYHPSCVSDFLVPATLSNGLVHLLQSCLQFNEAHRPTAEQLDKHYCLPTRCRCKEQRPTIEKFLEHIYCLSLPMDEAKKIYPTLTRLNLSFPPRNSAETEIDYPVAYSAWCDELLQRLSLFKVGTEILVPMDKINTHPVPVLLSKRSLHRCCRRSFRHATRASMHSVSCVPYSETETSIVLTNEDIKSCSRLLRSLQRREKLLFNLENEFSFTKHKSFSGSGIYEVGKGSPVSGFFTTSGAQYTTDYEDGEDGSDYEYDDDEQHIQSISERFLSHHDHVTSHNLNYTHGHVSGGRTKASSDSLVAQLSGCDQTPKHSKTEHGDQQLKTGRRKDNNYYQPHSKDRQRSGRE